MGAVLGELCRATLLHDVGYLESGLQSSYEPLVLGDELAGYARAFGRQSCRSTTRRSPSTRSSGPVPAATTWPGP